jgi:hypothetical protein
VTNDTNIANSVKPPGPLTNSKGRKKKKKERKKKKEKKK